MFTSDLFYYQEKKKNLSKGRELVFALCLYFSYIVFNFLFTCHLWRLNVKVHCSFCSLLIQTVPYKTDSSSEKDSREDLIFTVYTVKDVTRDSFTSINRLPEKSDEYGLMHVMAVKIIKTAILFLFISKTRNSAYFWYQIYVLERLCC